MITRLHSHPGPLCRFLFSCSMPSSPPIPSSPPSAPPLPPPPPALPHPFIRYLPPSLHHSFLPISPRKSYPIGPLRTFVHAKNHGGVRCSFPSPSFRGSQVVCHLEYYSGSIHRSIVLISVAFKNLILAFHNSRYDKTIIVES